jgi:hypothetical protein
MHKIHIVVMDGYPAFKEVILSTKYSLDLLGFDVEIILNKQIYPDVINIIFASHHISLEELKTQKVPIQNIIIYNLEQVGHGVPWMNAKYFRLMKNAHVWEYSTYNFTQLYKAGINNMSLVPIGYTPNLEIIPKIEQDIDVFFYGSSSERRIKTIEAIKAIGLNVVSTTEHGQFVDEQRDNLIARSKIILNMHFYDNAHIFEIVRVSYLLANHKAVVSELGVNTTIDPDIKKAICYGDLNSLPEICLDLVKNPKKLKNLEENGYNIIKQRDTTKFIQKGIEKYLSSKEQIFAIPTHIKQTACKLPKSINLGCGLDWKYDMLNIDYNDKYKPDLLIDLNKEINFNEEMDTWRFGKHSDIKGYFINIYANHIFECIDNLKNAMANCLNLLEEDGNLYIKVIYDLSINAWSSPEYKRHFNENSFFYYSNSMNLFNLGWYEHAFEFVEYHISLSNYGLELYYANDNNFDKVKNIPRAIDYLTFKLNKRKVNEDEKQLIEMQKTT